MITNAVPLRRRERLAWAPLALHFLAKVLSLPLTGSEMASTRTTLILIASVAISGSSASLAGQLPDRSLYSTLEWRMIGPFRAGRTIGATGVRGQTNVFYVWI